MNVSTFDIADIVIDEANKKFAPNLVVNQQLLDTFKKNCDEIDKLCDEKNVESLEISVDENNKTITASITLELPGIWENKNV